MIIDTAEKRAKRLDELQAPEISRLKEMSRAGHRMGDIVLQGKFGIDTDYQASDNGEPPAREEHE